MNTKELQREEAKRTAYYENDMEVPPGADVLCPFRSCYHKTEDCRAYEVENGKTTRLGKFTPVCGTRVRDGCPQWRNGPDDEVSTGTAVRWAAGAFRTALGKKAPWAVKRRKFAFAILEHIAPEGGRLG